MGSFCIGILLSLRAFEAGQALFERSDTRFQFDQTIFVRCPGFGARGGTAGQEAFEIGGLRKY